MTLEEAKIKVLKNGWIKKIGTIAEFEAFWVFCHDDEETRKAWNWLRERIWEPLH